MQIETREPSLASAENSPSPGGEGRGEGELSILDFISSTATLDRYHEIIDPAGWRLDAYRRNPVFQNAHNYGDILFTLGKALITEVRSTACAGFPASSPNGAEQTSPGQSVASPWVPSSEDTPLSPRGAGRGEGVRGNSQSRSYLFQRIQFATDVNPIARIAYGLYKGAFLNAVSVGFVPMRWENGTDGDSYRRKYLEQELLEVSAVAIPANPDALALGVKAGAVAKSDLADTLDLLRSLTVDYGPWRPDSLQRVALHSFSDGGSTPNHHLFTFARELRRILRST